MCGLPQSGSALVVALLVTFVLFLLGVSFLLMAQTESRIAANERNALQALYLAEAGAAVVHSWFDRPGNALGFPRPELVRRAQREVLDESDPYEGTRTEGTQYKRHPADSSDVDRDGDGLVDLFRPPYRGGAGWEHLFLGAEQAPDLRIADDDPDPAVGHYLAELSRQIYGPPLDSPGRSGQISRIEVYAPPYQRVGGQWTRFGVATIKVTARIYRRNPAGERTGVIAERTVKTVLNELPYATPVFGPLHACGDLRFRGRLEAHWGPVTVGGNLLGYDGDPAKIATSLPRQVPPGPRIDRLWVHLPGQGDCVREYNGRADGDVVQDPWLRVVVRESIVGSPAPVQPYPYLAQAYPLGDDCDPGSTDPLDCCDRSNLVQSQPLVVCPEYDYAFWKNAARSGRSNVHYYVPAGTAGAYLEQGAESDPQSFQAITDGRSGLFFFDTLDGRPPRDEDADGRPDNLVPAAIEVSGDWQSAGFIFLNADRLEVRGPLTPPQDHPLRAPGEPYLDGNGNRRHDPGEAWVNLAYPSFPGDPFRIDATDDLEDDGIGAGRPVRNSTSPHAFELPVAFRGILYTSGSLSAEGQAVFHGSVIVRGEVTLGGAGGSPDFYWDERILQGWPALGEQNLPRVVATRWSEEP
jgi:hypothetical protein